MTCRLSVLGIENTQGARRLWRLGNTEWQRRPREVYLARGLTWPDGIEVCRQIQCDARPIIFVGSGWPSADVWPSAPPPVISLQSVLSLNEQGAIELDNDAVAEFVAGSDHVALTQGDVADEENRGRIARLVDQRFVHGDKIDLINAFESQGLSTRETAKEMTERGVPIDHATVARKRKNVAGKHPPPSSRSVLRHASSQPRNARGRPIKDAEPTKDE